MLPSGMPTPALHISQIISSDADQLLFIHPNDNLARAETLLTLHKLNFLPVLRDPATPIGVVSLNSIVVARALNFNPTLASAIRKSHIVSINAEVRKVRQLIRRDEFALVRDNDGLICGTITLADTNDAIEKLTGPHLVIGEIERRLRRLLDRACPTKEDLRSATGKPGISATHELTLGGIEHAFRDSNCWKRLHWSIDQEVFVDEVESVRRIRNKFAHYDTDAPTPLTNKQNRQLNSFLDWLVDITSEN